MKAKSVREQTDRGLAQTKSAAYESTDSSKASTDDEKGQMNGHLRE